MYFLLFFICGFFVGGDSPGQHYFDRGSRVHKLMLTPRGRRAKATTAGGVGGGEAQYFQRFAVFLQIRGISPRWDVTPARVPSGPGF